MPYRYIALGEESTFGEAASNFTYYKLLRETITTTREDFFPETVEHWTVGSKAEGFFRTSGDFEVLVDPVVWPNLLVLFIGDPTTSQPDATGAPNTYEHVFTFGGDETVSSTGVKPFTVKIGVGVERDRQIVGCVMESLAIEAVKQEVVSCTCSIIGSGNESLVTASTPDWSAYTQPYLTFASASTMTIGGTDRLSTAPTIEAFRLTLTRGWDADHYVLGNRFLAAASLSGMATVEGSMDFSFTSQDEYERFLSSVGSSSAGDQSSFEVVLELQGATIEGTYKYEVEITLPKVYYTVSRIPVTARDRIVQTCDFRAIYDDTIGGAAKILVRNTTTSY